MLTPDRETNRFVMLPYKFDFAFTGDGEAGKEKKNPSLSRLQGNLRRHRCLSVVTATGPMGKQVGGGGGASEDTRRLDMS